MSRPRLIALLLALVTLVVFLPVARNDFVNFDDDEYVYDNPMVENGLTLAGIKWAFTTGHASNWHPLTWISHMLDCELFGLNAGAQHMVNVLFHAANAALLFMLLLRLTQRLWPSAMVAALFAWHPLHVESVAWIAERKDVLSTFFALLALSSYARYAQKKSPAGDRSSKKRSALPTSDERKPTPDYFLALIFFTLGLMAKPMLVTLPFVMLLLDFWPLNRMRNNHWPTNWPTMVRQLILEKWPFFVMAAASCVVTFLVQQQGHAVLTLEQMPIGFRLENAPVAVVGYLLKLFWPVNLAIVYPLNPVSTLALAASILTLVFVSGLAWHWRVAKPYFLFGWLWFLGTLVPVIGLVQVGIQAMADRYTYIPSIGFFIALVFLVSDWAARFQVPKVMAAGVVALILTTCVLLMEFQLQFWRNTETLFRHALAVTSNNYLADLNLGLALEQEGDLAGALTEYQETLRLNPSYPGLHNHLGIVFDRLGRHAESLAEYRGESDRHPDNAYLHNAVGSELATLGEFEAALKEFAEAKQLDPQYSAPHLETAKALFQLGRDAEGVPEFQTAAALDPDNFQVLAIAAHYFAADENAAGRNGQAALALAVKADDLSDHSQPMVLDNLAMAYAATGDFTNAQTCVRKAIDLATTLQMENIEPLRQRLELYNNHQPWRESFQTTNAPAKN
jgi:Flp pilus assembly protein TadD